MGAATALAHPFLSQRFLEQERHEIQNVPLPNAETWVWEAYGHIAGFISLLGNEVGAIFIGVGYTFPYGDYLELEVGSDGLNHVIWGAGGSYTGPGGTWYTRELETE